MFSMNFLYFYFTIILTTECSDLALSRWVTQFHAVEDLNLFQHYYIYIYSTAETNLQDFRQFLEHW